MAEEQPASSSPFTDELFREELPPTTSTEPLEPGSDPAADDVSPATVEGSSGPGWVPTAASVGLGLVVSALTTPIRDLRQPTIVENIDPSWQIALHQIVNDDIAWGSEVVNTLGPLGFAVFPFLSSGATAWFSIFVYAVIHVLAAALSIHVVAKRLVSIPGLGIQWVRLGLAGIVAWMLSMFVWTPLFEQLLVAEVCAAMFAVFCLDRLADRRAEELPTESAETGRFGPDVPLAVFLGVAASLMLLIKLSTGLQAVAVGLLTIAALAWLSRNVRSGIEMGIAWGAGLFFSYVIGWIVLGQSLGEMFGYVTSAVEMAGAYAGNMGVERPELAWSRTAGLALMAVVVVVGLLRDADRSWLDRVAVLLPLGPFLFFAFKLGFVRQDPDHVVPFFLSLAAVAVVLVGTKPRSLLAIAVCCLAVFAGWRAEPNDPPLNEVFAVSANLTQAQENLRLLTSGGYRTEAVDDFRLATRARAGFSPENLDLLAGSRVHIDPVETSLLWIHDEFEWAAPPVFQSYLAFTEHFDDANAQWLRDDSTAPDFVLRSPWAIDRRHSAHESPEYMIELLCRYEPVGTQVHGKGRRAVEYTILQRGENRCGPIVEVATADLPVPSKVPYPAGCDTAAGDLPVFQIHGLESLTQRVRSTAFKDANYIVRFQKRWHKLIPGTASQWHLVPTEGMPPWIGAPEAVNQLFVGYLDEPRLTVSEVDVVFGCLPVSS